MLTLAWAWNNAGLRVELLPNVEMDVMNWKKLAANCDINLLTALRGCANGGLRTRKCSAILYHAYPVCPSTVEI